MKTRVGCAGFVTRQIIVVSERLIAGCWLLCAYLDGLCEALGGGFESFFGFVEVVGDGGFASFDEFVADVGDGLAELIGELVCCERGVGLVLFERVLFVEASHGGSLLSGGESVPPI